MEIVLVGRSNVGKSSVVRQLTGKRVAIGKRPGVTRRILRYTCGELDVVDMPGFGYMAGVSRARQESVKTEIVRYLEKNRSNIVLAIQVIDARSFSEIVERWEERNQIPIDKEMFQFLKELKIHSIVVVNKIDLIHIEERDGVLDGICEEFGLFPPWRQWQDFVAPISAKTGEGVQDMRKLVKQKMQELGHHRFVKYLK